MRVGVGVTTFNHHCPERRGMTTATTQKQSASERQKRKQDERDQLYAKVTAANRRRNEFDAETEALRAELTERIARYPEETEGVDKRPKPGTATKVARQDSQAPARGEPV
jgi:hypothetical protein